MHRRTLLAAAGALPVLLAARAGLCSPEGRIAVFGDSLSDGIWGSLVRSSHGHASTYVRMGRISTGLVKQGLYDWMAGADTISHAGYRAAIVVIGLNDQQTIDQDGYHPFGTPAWSDIYATRVAAVAASFEATNTPLVWIGLPRVRDQAVDRGVQTINAILEQAAREHDALFVPTYEQTSLKGTYATYLPDSRGQQVAMRAADGMHFTPDGYDMITALVLAAVHADPRFASCGL